MLAYISQSQGCTVYVANAGFTKLICDGRIERVPNSIVCILFRGEMIKKKKSDYICRFLNFYEILFMNSLLIIELLYKTKVSF